MSAQPRRAYLDVCALGRPFDDQAQMRIRLETEAVQLILSYVRSGDLTLVVSPVHEIEINAIEDVVEREDFSSMLGDVGTHAPVKLQLVRQRAEDLAAEGLGPADAAHLAFAEASNASFVTCDDRLIRQCRRVGSSVWCGNPVAFCSEEGLR